MACAGRAAQRFALPALYASNLHHLLHELIVVSRRTDADSGHGGLTKDLDGDEESGYDEVIYPVDFKQNGHIVDDVRLQRCPPSPSTPLTAVTGAARPACQAPPAGVSSYGHL